ncbi:hypothetical protein G647_04779 [Cladophialophora carrionii CBS 160.54]|uniref:Uncharacterized protein n=1 Tax=Cladophialophora carrionii CBS 160.54 TaxID=1279043 RepID=V9D9L0_9EURO|nr:uncharacterized protein G647_04779 [Cladophialophora carrionii CBS 160.54]ETI22983.1 hypothetical protein G647_04779 [Cladophialophora carrionii CBS 160.54]
MVQVATVSPPVGQFVIHTLLQIAGFAVAIAFGVYAVRSVHAAVLANSFSREANSFSREAIQQALAANQLALLATCLQAGNQTENQDITDICSRIIRGAADLLPSAASSLFPDLPPPPSSSSSPGDSSSTLSPPTPTSTRSPLPTPAPTDPFPSANRSSVSTGAVAGAVIGSALLVATVSITCIYIRRRRRRRGHSSRRGDHDDSTAAPTPSTPTTAPRRRPASSFGSIFREVFMNSTMTSWTPSVEEDVTTTRDEERGGQTERQREK